MIERIKSIILKFLGLIRQFMALFNLKVGFFSAVCMLLRKMLVKLIIHENLSSC